ncbi:aquaporin-11 [Ischnura elegans]|uniref:aquaporin-11 n=1 Tax=Ischnura elegans TaxID=197161 RepID=UPI001ED86F82|nr:aquaporin-11 [Ischnura elegans]
MASAFDFCISLLWIGLVSALACGLRRLVKSYYEAAYPFGDVPFVQVLIEEAIAAAELCGCCFELIIVADNYGVFAYAVLLFLLTIWWSNCWGNATACPYNHLEDVLTGDTDMRTALLKAIAQLVGGISVFRFIQFLWRLELADTHVGRAEEDCTADLQVTMFVGALIEATATCLCRVCSRALGDLQPSFSTALDAFIGTSLVVAAFNYSGGYFNPVLATSLKFGCKGNTAVEHLVVYWIGACSGALLSVMVYKHPRVQRMIVGEEKKKPE